MFLYKNAIVYHYICLKSMYFQRVYTYASAAAGRLSYRALEEGRFKDEEERDCT